MPRRKKILIALVTAASLAAAAVIPFKASSQIDIAVQGGGENPHHRMVSHKDLDKALSHLYEARSSLMHAPSGYAGHRAKAIHAIDDAIEQCKHALVYADSGQP